MLSPLGRNVTILAASQALMMSAMSLVVATSALVGYALAEDKTLATLPLAVQSLAAMVTTFPAAMIMERTGRKAGFLLGAVFAIAGGALATGAIIDGEFARFVLAAGLIGVFNGFGGYFRFAAAESVAEADKGRAIGYVMAGGIVAALVGPNLAHWSSAAIESAAFAGSYGALTAVYVIAFLVLAWLKPQSARAAADSPSDIRPLKAIVAQPEFVVALLCATVGYGVMSLVMNAAPLAMHQHAYTFADTSFVIQWHMLGMFAPSLITGQLIRRFGVYKILLTGAMLELACALVNLNGAAVGHFWGALLLLGLGWNFLFIGATTLLTDAYRPAERTRIQALNDFTVFGTVTLCALSAGALHDTVGWSAINAAVIPLLMMVAVAVSWLAYAGKIQTRAV